MPDEPKWTQWPAGAPGYRVLPYDWDPRDFNPNTTTDPANPLEGGRFHPFVSATGVRVATLYVASSLTAAIAETLLHDLSLTPTAHPYSLSMSKVRSHRFAILTPKTDLRLIDLAGAGADRVRIPNELISWCLREHYPISRRAAHLLHTKYPSAQGIRWTSRRYPPQDCTVVFGDRVGGSARALVVEAPPMRELHEPGTEGYPTLEAVMVEAGIVPYP